MNAGDPKQVEAQQSRLRRQAEHELLDLRAVLSIPEGRRFVWRLLEDTAPLQEAFTGNSTTFYKLGKQAYGRRVLGLILGEMPEVYAQMQREAKEHNEKEARES